MSSLSFCQTIFHRKAPKRLNFPCIVIFGEQGLQPFVKVIREYSRPLINRGMGMHPTKKWWYAGIDSCFWMLRQTENTPVCFAVRPVQRASLMLFWINKTMYMVDIGWTFEKKFQMRIALIVPWFSFNAGFPPIIMTMPSSFPQDGHRGLLCVSQP